MKKTLFTVIVCTLFTYIYAQGEIQQLPETKYANYKLTKVNYAQVDGVSHFDLDGKSTKFWVDLDFGKNILNIQLHETGTDKLIWGYYGMKKSVNFTPNREKSSSVFWMYEFELTESGHQTKCHVTYLHGANRITVTLAYSVVDTSTQKVTESIIASGDL